MSDNNDGPIYSVLNGKECLQCPNGGGWGPDGSRPWWQNFTRVGETSFGSGGEPYSSMQDCIEDNSPGSPDPSFPAMICCCGREPY